MMEPGFYNRDCMDAMREFPDKFFDLAICDPPYGIQVASHKGGKIVGGEVQDHSAARTIYGKARSRAANLNPTTPSTTTARRTKGISGSWRG